MRTFAALAALVIAAALPACDVPNTRLTGDPVTLDMPGGNVGGPRLTTRPDGRLVLSWMQLLDEGATLAFATISDGRLGPPQAVVTDPHMFVNWADLPSVMQVADEHWLAHWLRYSADQTYSYDVVVSRSRDGGQTWSEPLTAHTDGTTTEHGFVSMHRAADGTALLWLDGRNTPDAPMSLRSAVITAGGERRREQLVDGSVCDCCQTDVAVSARGPIAVYRNRTQDEIRDIYVTRQIDGAWQPGVPLFEDHWEIAGCPVNGPTIVADGEQVAVAWFSAAGGVPVVRVMLSQDGGTTFGAPVEVSAARPAGYVGLAFIDDRGVAVSWVARTGSGNSLRLRTVGMDGTPGPVQQVAEIAQARVFPQLGYQAGSLYLFWTDIDGPARLLKGARIPVSGT